MIIVTMSQFNDHVQNTVDVCRNRIDYYQSISVRAWSIVMSVLSVCLSVCLTDFTSELQAFSASYTWSQLGLPALMTLHSVTYFWFVHDEDMGPNSQPVLGYIGRKHL